jgi:CBS domain-containing protein
VTCKDIMTPNPSSCLPGDSVAIAAQIMKRNDVGPVLVVSDQHENRLIGIVTDRDLALKVLAEGRDPHTTRVDEVMSLNPICLREDEDTHRALQLMANHQVRRIPIVDQDNRLSGIVAQADIALHEDEGEVGRVVEHISEPYGSQGWSERGVSTGRGWIGASSLATGALCLGLGAGLMYVLGPSRESDRSSEPWDTDSGLASRIRSKIRRAISRGQGVEVTTSNGAVTLSGPILESEVRDLLECVNSMPGVLSV